MNLKGNKLRMKGKYLMKKLEDIMKTLIKLELKMQLKGKKHQDDLLYQINGKNLQKKKEINDKFYEEREAKIREIEFSKKIK